MDSNLSQSGITPRPSVVRTLDAILDHAGAIDAVRRGDLSWGDTVVISTKNSEYTLTLGSGDIYFVTGGWFDQHSRAPVRISISGCSWGGTTICNEIVAAPGLFLEFGNGVRTTRIQRVTLWKSGQPSSVN